MSEDTAVGKLIPASFVIHNQEALGAVCVWVGDRGGETSAAHKGLLS